MQYNILFADYDHSSGGIEVRIEVQCPKCGERHQTALIADYKETMLFSQLTLQCRCGSIFSPLDEDKTAGEYFTEYMATTTQRRKSGAYGYVDNEVLDCFLEDMHKPLPEKRSCKDSVGKRKRHSECNPWYQRDGIATA